MKDNVVLLGATPLTRPVFDQEFPSLQQIDLPAYNVAYSTSVPLWLKLAADAPRISQVIRKEHQLLGKIIAEHQVDVVISDNRFGLYHKAVHTVFITHQLFLKSPVFVAVAGQINRRYIKRFDEVWVPDYENESQSLSGELSHHHVHFHKDIKYIGPQSRLKELDTKPGERAYDYLILLSGPEPHRTELEKALINKFNASDKTAALARGTGYPPDHFLKNKKNISVFDFPDPGTLKQLIVSSRKIICRSGYSSLMDLNMLEKKDLILIPTPGQTEQEYLARYWHKTFGAAVCLQKDIQHLTL